MRRTQRSGRPSSSLARAEPGDRRDEGRAGEFPTNSWKDSYAPAAVNGKLPIGPIPISPLMLSPETLPLNASVSGIGLVIESFQATSSTLTVPSKISAEPVSSPCVPVSAPPALFKSSVALRSPIGVLIVIFHFPSTAISSLLTLDFSQTGMVL